MAEGTQTRTGACRGRPAHPVQQHPDQPGGGVEVGDGAAPHRPDGDDVAGGPPDHRVGIVAHGQDVAAALVDGDHGRLVELDALAPDVDERVGRAQVDREVAGHGRLHGAGGAAARGRAPRGRPGRARRPGLAAGDGHGGGQGEGGGAATVDVAAADLDPADQDPAGTCPPASANASALERVGAQPASRSRALPSTQGCIGRRARPRSRPTPRPATAARRCSGRPAAGPRGGAGRPPGRLSGPDPVVRGHVVDAAEPARDGQDEGGDGVGRGQAWSGGSCPRTPTMAGPIRLRAGSVPQPGAHTPAPRSTTTARPTGARFPGPLRRAFALQRDPLAVGEHAGGRELGVGAGRVGLGDGDGVVGVGPVDDPAGPQHHLAAPAAASSERLVPSSARSRRPSSLRSAASISGNRTRVSTPATASAKAGSPGPAWTNSNLGPSSGGSCLDSPSTRPTPGSSSSASASSLAAGAAPRPTRPSAPRSTSRRHAEAPRLPGEQAAVAPGTLLGPWGDRPDGSGQPWSRGHDRMG